MKVRIPFKKRFEKPLIDGTKVVTRRTKQYGKKGDWFEYRGLKFRLTAVYSDLLGLVDDKEAQREGCKDLEDFIECWKDIHFHRGWDRNWVVWVHEFELEGKAPFQMKLLEANAK